MNISEGLVPFIRKAVIKSKRDGYLGLLTNTKGQTKFARSLDHDFEKVLDDSKFISKIESNELEQLGDLYCSNGVTNNSTASMYDLYGKAPWEGGWLLINKTGTLAIYRPEGRMDDEIFIRAAGLSCQNTGRIYLCSLTLCLLYALFWQNRGSPYITVSH